MNEEGEREECSRLAPHTHIISTTVQLVVQQQEQLDEKGEEECR